MVTVSLCMIVKNEEKVLERCLNSIADLMDEIIIVDTGSTDQTKKIAAKYTDKIYDFTWIGDFSAARNFAFEKASMEYIYSADADEVVDEKNRERFRILKEAMLPDVEIVQMYYCNQLQFGSAYNFDKEYRPKLFRRLRTFSWEEPVHEMIRLQPVIFDSDIEIMHLPEKNHGGRDFQIFHKMNEDGKRLSKRLHHMYATELFISGTNQDFIEAEMFFRGSLSDTERGMDEIKEAACVCSKIARLKKDVHLLLKASYKDLLQEPSAEVCYEMGQYYFECEDYEEAVVWFYNAAKEASCILNIHYCGDYPLEKLSECYRLLGQEEQVEFYTQEKELWIENYKKSMS